MDIFVGKSFERALDQVKTIIQVGVFTKDSVEIVEGQLQSWVADVNGNSL